MEPGLRDREYKSLQRLLSVDHQLQWSPVLETGNTTTPPTQPPGGSWLQWSPVLETGNTSPLVAAIRETGAAAMEPGLRDREYPPIIPDPTARWEGCIGARS